MQRVDPRAELRADDLTGFAPSVNRRVERQRALEKTMRSITGTARGARSAASRLATSVLASAVVVTAACSDTTPTAVRPTAIVPPGRAIM
jgi:hypothetical protein